MKYRLNVKTVGELISILQNYPPDLALGNKLGAMETIAHPENPKESYYLSCFGQGKEDSTFGCCERAKQLKQAKPVKILRLFDIS